MSPAAPNLDPIASGNALQQAYSASWAAWRAEVEELRAAGAFQAPEHLRPGLQAELLLQTAMPADPATAEAA